MTFQVRAPGKVNLCLFLGPVREDGRHELVTLFESVSLADEVSVAVAGAVRGSLTREVRGSVADEVRGSVAGDPPRPTPADEVVCAGIPEPNIVSRTLDGLRERGWRAPPVRVTIGKRIPIAGGMGGGSADAAAVLRVAPSLSPVSDPVVRELAAALGSDVPSQLVPGLVIGTGAGDVVESVAEPLPPHAFVIVPQSLGLSTADVYREADRLGLPRDADDLRARHRELVAAVRAGAYVLGNDLEPAALSLQPEIGHALDAVRECGADHAMVSGSGPTVFGLFAGADAAARADSVAAELSDRYPGATSAVPVGEEFGAPRGT